MWSEPETVGGGVSTTKVSSRGREGSQRWMPRSSHARPQRASAAGASKCLGSAEGSMERKRLMAKGG
jgi:hypothetical protein